jgi:hypothetical protein
MLGVLVLSRPTMVLRWAWWSVRAVVLAPVIRVALVLVVAVPVDLVVLLVVVHPTRPVRGPVVAVDGQWRQRQYPARYYHFPG